MAEATIVDTKATEALKAALLAIEPIARKLANVDRTKLDDSEVKFLLIRAVRLEHLAREVRLGKSQRS